ncbi:beta/alpha barrel domain-containing protein [Streptomyces xanthii]|uniref:indole-3-glycerol-phosphate synthase n=1 Tax=Streptomyces xanthii TaxID=2768069 RepID=A0A7H1BKQ1_9ACTN|nr:indole-3-glycerol-phosphate synthase [Streptomyces xanthii]QNS09306.1 indole-3-glycerol-phosphate synthase [Streptomyces xanthii]
MSADFAAALRAAARPVVMEVKRQDADGRELLGGRTVAEVVAAYEAAGAPCVSVVTGRWFGGTEALLAEVAALTSLPLLRKDFVTSRGQLRRSRELGASAVLLTARLLAAGTLERLTETALELGLTPFVEVADAAEAAAVPYGESCVVAVNNKDIATGERGAGDLTRGPALLPAVRATGTGCAVSASGIDGPRTAAGLLDAGFDGLLIGTGLLTAGSLPEWIARFDRARKGGPGR